MIFIALGTRITFYWGEDFMKLLKSDNRIGVNILAWMFLHSKELDNKQLKLFTLMNNKFNTNDRQLAMELSKSEYPVEEEIDEKQLLTFVLLEENPFLNKELKMIFGQVSDLQKEIKEKDKTIKDLRQQLGLDEFSEDDPSEDAIVSRVYKYLNQKTHKRYRANSGGSRELRARIRSGMYSEQDFMTIIDNKCQDWLGKEDMEQYLRPTTLFLKSHVDDYLNERKRVKKKPVKQNFTNGQTFMRG